MSRIVNVRTFIFLLYDSSIANLMREFYYWSTLEEELDDDFRNKGRHVTPAMTEVCTTRFNNHI